jgi:4-amino-4-deoxy-L-arabinose transferase-like glycosyltransferase
MKKALLIIVIFNLIRLLFLPFMGMMPQDAYYYFYSEHLSLSYFDHPPMVAYMLYLFSLVFGKSVITIKLADFVITAGTQWAFFAFSSKILRSERKYTSWILLASTLMISSLSMVTTPDVPLLLFWVLSLNSLYVALFRKNNWHWIWAGIFMGLAFDSKYTALAIPAGLFLFLVFSGRYRGYLQTIWPYLSGAFMVLAAWPVIKWNIDNEFASFVFQSSERAETISGITIHNFFGLLGTQLFLLAPIGFAGLWWVAYKYFRRIFIKPNQVNPELWFLLAFFLPMFMGFYMISFFYWVKLNWLMPAYISGIIILARYLDKKWIKWQLIFSGVFHVLVMIEVLFYPFPIKSDDTWFGWEDFANQTEVLWSKHPDAFVFSEDNYKTTAQLMFYTNKKIYGRNVIGKNALHYDYIGDDLNQLKGKNALFIDSHRRFSDDNKAGEQLPAINQYFESYQELDPILIKHRGKTVRKFAVYYCVDYKGIDP